MKRIPIKTVESIAKDFGYDQVIVFARKTGNDPEPHGEHLTTYGVNAEHCRIAAHIGNFLKTKILGWQNEEHAARIKRLRQIVTIFERCGSQDETDEINTFSDQLNKDLDALESGK